MGSYEVIRRFSIDGNTLALAITTKAPRACALIRTNNLNMGAELLELGAVLEGDELDGFRRAALHAVVVDEDDLYALLDGAG